MYQGLKECFSSLTEVEELFCDRGENTLPSFMETLKYLRTELLLKAEEFTQWMTRSKRSCVEKGEGQGTESGEMRSGEVPGEGGGVEVFRGRVENLIAGLLLSVQSLTKAHPRAGGSTAKGRTVLHTFTFTKGID